MKTYAKLVDKRLVMCIPPNVSNPTADYVEEYAETNGYKHYISKTAPHQYCSLSYKETAKQITEVWTEMPIEAVRARQLSSVRMSCNAAYHEAMEIYTQAEIAVAQQGGADVIAVMASARGVSIEQQTADLTQALTMGKVLNACLAGYSLKLEDAIKTAETVVDIAAIAWSREEFAIVVETEMAKLQATQTT